MSRGGRAAAAEVRVRAGGIVQWARDEHPDRVVAKGVECWIHGCVCKRQEAKGTKEHYADVWRLVYAHIGRIEQGAVVRVEDVNQLSGITLGIDKISTTND